MVAGGIAQTPTYLSGLGKEAVQNEFKKQVDSFVANKVDFLIAEVLCVYFTKYINFTLQHHPFFVLSNVYILTLFKLINSSSISITIN